MVQELIREKILASQFVRFRFDEPRSPWPLSDCSRFFHNLIPLCELLMEIDSTTVEDRLIEHDTYEYDFMDINAGYSYFVDDLTHYEVIEEPMLRLRPIHRVEILSFSFNSPIDLLVATGRAVSRNAIVKITTAYKHVVHHAAMDQKLRAEADLADQVALKARLENIKTAIKIHETIKDPELQDRFAQVVHDTFVPLVSPDGPRLKSIDLTDESKY
ncbi:hypothetical protein [Rhizobium leguminosarum]|uniref:hypothetical protein n=1 Tax=Rhizobium leguminosarum TaxID=384 RepID=UPI003D6E159E